jgi:hypothetical protein
MTDPAQSNLAHGAPALPPQLEARIAAIEIAGRTPDFDASSWLWMIVLGVVIPLLMLAVGWCA